MHELAAAAEKEDPEAAKGDDGVAKEDADPNPEAQPSAATEQ